VTVVQGSIKSRWGLPGSRVRELGLELPATIFVTTTLSRWKCSQTRPTEPGKRKQNVLSFWICSCLRLFPTPFGMSPQMPVVLGFYHLIIERAFKWLTLWAIITWWGIHSLKGHVLRENNKILRKI
jgi:hypothetical protein